MELKEVVTLIKRCNHDMLQEVSSFKLKTILFFTQIEYYTTHGTKLFDNDIHCYYNDLQIDGFEQMINEDYNLDEISDKSLYEMVESISEELLDLSDEDLIDTLYRSKAFLKANTSRGNRLLLKTLKKYHQTYEIYSRIERNSRSPIIDEVLINYDYVDDIIDDLEILN